MASTWSPLHAQQWNITPTASNATIISLDWIDRLRRICEIGLTLPIGCFGLLGNMFAFVVLCHHNPRTTTRVLLQAIAVTDWLALFCSLILRSLRDAIPGYDKTYFFLQSFRWLYPCTYIFRFGGSWITVLLTVDRFIAVRYPLHAQRLCTLRRTYVLMASTSVCTLLFSLPRFFEFRLVQEGEHIWVEPSDLLKHQQYTVGYRIVAYLLLMYLIPMVLMVVLNYVLLSTLREARKRRRALLENCQSAHGLIRGHPNKMLSSLPFGIKQQSPSNNQSITIIVIIVVLISIICNSTAMVAHVLWSLNNSFPELCHIIERPRRAMSNLSNLLVTVNSAINFVIYCLCSRNFRHVCVQTFSRMYCCARAVERSQTNVTVASSLVLRQISGSTTCTTPTRFHRNSEETTFLA